MRFTLVLIGLVGSLNCVKAQVVSLLDENFNNGFPASWTRWNLDGLVPDPSVAFVNNAWVAYEDVDSVGTGDSCAVATSFYDPSGMANDWMITPPITLKSNGNILSWEVKSQDPSYPDGYNVYIATTLSIDSFAANPRLFHTDFELPDWTYREVSLDDYVNQTVYIAFRAISEDQYLLLVDNIKVTADTLLSVHENPTAAQKLDVSPNPASEVVNVSGTSVISNLLLIDLSGKVLARYTPMANRFTLPVSHLEKGMYLVQAVYANGGTSQVKIIRQ